MRSSVLSSALLIALVAVGCGSVGMSDEDRPTSTDVVNTVPKKRPVVVGEVVPENRVLFTTGAATLRSAPSDTASAVRTLAAGARLVTDGSSGTNGWYAVQIRGSKGFVRAEGLEYAPTVFEGSGGHAVTIENVGHAYHWGKASLPNASPTKATQGSCTGNCPNCTAKGSYGADCSGYVGLVFELPKASSHPVSTAVLEKANDMWVSISREDAKFGDAFAYNDGGGHVVIYENGDAWGTPMVYEARGCAYGIVHNLHKLSSKYVGIRRW